MRCTHTDLPYVYSYFSDNAHVAQSRLILLDATLIFFVTATMHCYIKFMKHRYLCVTYPFEILPMLTYLQ